MSFRSSGEWEPKGANHHQRGPTVDGSASLPTRRASGVAMTKAGGVLLAQWPVLSGTYTEESTIMVETDAKQATPVAELERQIMSADEPKNEREWWARREIERLRAARAERLGIAANIQPCPFCGVSAEVMKSFRWFPHGWQVSCPNCQCCTWDRFETPEKAIEVWNRRESFRWDPSEGGK